MPSIDARVYPIENPKGDTLAFASVTIDCVAISGIRIMDSDDGLIVKMPQSESKDGQTHDVACPLPTSLREAVNEVVVDELYRVAVLAPEDRGYDKTDMSEANELKADDIKVSVRVYPIAEPKGSTVAFASLNVDDLVGIRGVRVVEGSKGLFAQMPQSRDSEFNYRDVAFPITADLRKKINDVVVDKYKTAVRAAERGPSLEERLIKGAEKAAAQAASQVSELQQTAAKSRNAGVLD